MNKIKTQKLKIVPDARGRLGEILRNDNPFFKKFGQVYFTTAYPGVVKAWHKHMLQTDCICCISGDVKLVLYDNKDESFKTFIIGEHNPLLVQIPPEIWHGFKNIGTKDAIVINIPDKPYDYKNPDEYRLTPHLNSIIIYNWDERDE